jgi:fucose permease
MLTLPGATVLAPLLIIAYLGFISLGLPDPVAGVAWPSVRDSFALSQASFGAVFIALGCGYCASGFFGGKLTQTLGLGNLLWVSSALVAIAMFGSAFAPAWPLFVASAALWGLGSGGIDAGLNAYVSNNFSARHVNWLHACYSLGATLGPLVMTAVMLAAGSWRTGYVLVGAILAAMTLLFLITKNRWTDTSHPAAADSPAQSGLRAALRDFVVWLQIVVFFLYVGLEFTVGQWSFTLLTESRGIRSDMAGALVGAYYSAIGVGRILAGALTQRIGLDRLIRFSLLTALAGTVLLAFQSLGPASLSGLVLIGLGLAPVFPCLMARTPQRLGPERALHAVGFQVSAGMLGAALVPGIAGLLAQNAALEWIAEFSVLLAILLMASHEFILQAGPRTTPA